MKRLVSLFIFQLLFLPISWGGDILYIDLNGSDNEVTGCQEGLKALNAKKKKANPNAEDDYLQRVDVGQSDLVTALTQEEEDLRIRAEQAIKANPSTPWPKGVKRCPLSQKGKVTPCQLTLLISAYDNHLNLNFDTIVISGDDGNGEFFGKNGFVNSSEMKKILDLNPKSRDGITMSINNGCYTATAYDCQNLWHKNMAPNIKTTIGFAGQAPSGTRESNRVLMRDLCRKRPEIEAAQTTQEFDLLFDGIANVNSVTLAICSDNGVCTHDYKDGSSTTNSCFKTYEEINRQCDKFNPKAYGVDAFENLMLAQRPGYESPPEVVPGGDCRGSNCLRSYYSYMQRWRHCIDEVAAGSAVDLNNFTYDPVTVANLFFFNSLKRNLLEVHGDALLAYDSELKALLPNGKYELANLTGENLNNLSRKEINTRTKNAITDLGRLLGETSHPETLDRIEKARSMAYQLDLTLRLLKNECVPFEWAHDDAQSISPCIPEYGGTPQWPPQN